MLRKLHRLKERDWEPYAHWHYPNDVMLLCRTPASHPWDTPIKVELGGAGLLRRRRQALAPGYFFHACIWGMACRPSSFGALSLSHAIVGGRGREPRLSSLLFGCLARAIFFKDLVQLNSKVQTPGIEYAMQTAT